MVLFSPCGSSSITVRRLRERTGVGEFVHELAKALATSGAAGNDQIAVFTSSWKDRPDPALASEMPSVRIVDVKVPVRALVWAWNRLEWPPVEWFAGRMRRGAQPESVADPGAARGASRDRARS